MPRTTKKRSAPAAWSRSDSKRLERTKPLALMSIGNDALVSIARFLSARDLGRFACTCKTAESVANQAHRLALLERGRRLGDYDPRTNYGLLHRALFFVLDMDDNVFCYDSVARRYKDAVEFSTSEPAVGFAQTRNGFWTIDDNDTLYRYDHDFNACENGDWDLSETTGIDPDLSAGRDGTNVFIASRVSGHTIAMLDSVTGLVTTVYTHSSEDETITCVACSPDGRRVVFAVSDCTVGTFTVGDPAPTLVKHVLPNFNECVFVGDYIYVTCELATRPANQFLWRHSMLEPFDTDWVRVAEIPRNRSSYSLVESGGRVLLVGGSHLPSVNYGLAERCWYVDEYDPLKGEFVRHQADAEFIAGAAAYVVPVCFVGS